MSEFFLQLFCELNESYSVIIEDDGRVAYAYLYLAEEIVGDIWLYNQLETPGRTDWNAKEMPFLNPAEFIVDDNIINPIKDNSEVDCKWFLNSDNEFLQEVDIFLRGNLIAKLKHGSMPGWSTLVKKDGPLAKILR
jgi:hypothetical protein